MPVLGIETSCDETASSLVNEDGVILSHVVRSQTEEHLLYGGVVPEIAARAHIASIRHVVAKTLADAGEHAGRLEAVAATVGPGLIGGVMVGAMFGKGFASARGLPFYAVDHLEAHALTVRMTPEGKACAFPFLLFLLSGGHCRICVCRGVGDTVLYGSTRDDAVGECFDKTAKMLGLPYPGGPAVEMLAREGDANAFAFPEPLRGEPDCDMSLSGLKTAVRREIEAASPEKRADERFKADICASFQHTICAMLRRRAGYACERFLREYGAEHAKAAVAGGVAANAALRAVFAEETAKHGFSLHIAPPALCTDNGAMIAWAGAEYRAAGIAPDINARVYARDAMRRKKAY